MEDFVPRSEYMERIGRSDDRMRDFDRRLVKVEEFGEKLQSMAISLQGMVVTLQSMQKEQAEQGERLTTGRNSHGLYLRVWSRVWLVFCLRKEAFIEHIFDKQRDKIQTVENYRARSHRSPDREHRHTGWIHSH